jgi:hypothetical protein
MQQVQPARQPGGLLTHMLPGRTPLRPLQDDIKADSELVCVRNCTCPADGAACSLAKDCSIKIDIGGGSKRHSGGALFFWTVFSVLLGSVAALGYIHWNGIPPWLPLRERGYAMAGMYNELSGV